MSWSLINLLISKGLEIDWHLVGSKTGDQKRTVHVNHISRFNLVCWRSKWELPFQLSPEWHLVPFSKYRLQLLQQLHRGLYTAFPICVLVSESRMWLPSAARWIKINLEHTALIFKLYFFLFSLASEHICEAAVPRQHPLDSGSQQAQLGKCTIPCSRCGCSWSWMQFLNAGVKSRNGREWKHSL